MSSSSTPIFNGNSRYASDFQAVIQRSVAIASLPLQQLQNQKNQLTDQQTALNALDTQFSALQTAISNLGASTGNLLSSSVSDGTVLSASVAQSALQGSYLVKVLSPGSFSYATSTDGLTAVTDPATQSLSSASSFTLTVGGVPHTITPAANNLNALAAAINQDSTAGVQATILNFGSPSAPDYRLSLQSQKLGNVTLQLNDGSADLLDTTTAGSLATYQVNGQPATPISSDSRSVTLAPGVTANLLGVGTSTITVSRTASSIANSLSSFVNAYNATVDELNKSRGQNAGALSGQSIVYSLSQSLRSLANYSGTSTGVTSLTDLGLTFDGKGKLNLDSTVLSGASGAQLDDAVSFLGSTTSGGFLKAATDRLKEVEDPTTGLLKTTLSATANSLTRQNQLISDNQDRIDQLQTNLQAQMAHADAIIAQLEQQVTYFTGLFQSMYLPKQQQ